MKRKIILFFTAIITILMLTACSGGVDNAKQGKYYLNGDISKPYIVIGENNTMGFYDVDFSEMEKVVYEDFIIGFTNANREQEGSAALNEKKNRKFVTK